MYARDVLTALRRRWAVFVAGLLVTAGVTFAAIGMVPSEYQATASLVFIPPSQAISVSSHGRLEGTNPFLNFTSAMAATSEVVTKALSSPTMAEKLKATGAVAAYKVGIDPNSDAPTLSVEATSQDPKSALVTRNAVVAAVQRQLRTIQLGAGAPSNQFVHAQVDTTSDTAGRVHGSLVRAVVVIIALGVALSCSAATFTENRYSQKSTTGPQPHGPALAAAPASS